MNDIITAEQKKEFVIEALGIAGFTENPEFPGMYAQINGNIKTVVDLTAGTSAYLYDIKNKAKIKGDNDAGDLAKIDKIILEAENGQMPARTEADLVYSPDAEGAVIAGSDANCSAEPSRRGGPEKRAPPVPAKQHHSPESNEPEVFVPPAELVHSSAPPAPFIPPGTMIKDIQPGLKEIGKIKIGRKGAIKTSPKGTQYRPPEKFDHFEIKTLHKDDNGDFIPDATVMGLIGDDCKELDVSLLYNDPSLNFFTRYNQYKGGKCMCSGDGVQAIKSDGTKLKCDPNTCAVFATKKCKPNGILSVILKDSPRLGGVYKFRTTSYNSIRSIMSSQFFIQSLTGGILANIPLKMTVAPMSVNPVSSPTAQTIYVVNLEYPGTVDDLRKQTLQLMTEQAGMQGKIAELEAQARVAISAPESKEEIQDVELEFYPENTKEV